MTLPSSPPVGTCAVPGLINLRDVGGLSAGGDRRVRYRALFRSATPLFLNAVQAQTLVSNIGLRLRIDLRSTQEVAEASNPDLAAVEPASIHLPLRTGGACLRDGPVDELDARDGAAGRVASHYLRYIQHSPKSVTAVVRLLADPGNHATLLHCTAGKDRTGVVVAVVLDALGVSADDIVDEYARTRDHLDDLLAQLRSLPAYEARLATLPEEALGAEPEAMRGFLGRLQELHGGSAAYLRKQGLGEDELAGLRRALVEEIS